MPAHQLTTDPSLPHRLEAANARDRELVEDNQRLRRQLAHALGQRRAAATLEREQDPSPRQGDALR